MAYGIYGKVQDTTQRVTDIGWREAQTWPAGFTETALTALPTTDGPYILSGSLAVYSATFAAQDLAGLSGFKGMIADLVMTWLTTGTISVGPGVCRDSADLAFMALTASVTVDQATKDAIQGIQRKALTGTCAATTASGVVTGTSTLFLTEFGTRTGTGTITGAGTTITGTGTKFLSEVAINDLIGTNAKGYSRITAIASDTSLTLQQAIPGGSPAGAAPVIIEQPTIKVGTNNCDLIKSITSDTSLTTFNNGSAIVSGQAAKAGDLVVTGNTAGFLYVFLVAGASGTGCIFSTARTTPWLPTGYDVSYRRIGAVSLVVAGGAMIEFSQSWTGKDRLMVFEQATNTNGNRLVSGGAATAWTALAGAAAIVPPTSRSLYITNRNIAPTALTNTFTRPRSTGSTSTSRALILATANGGQGTNTYFQNCDGAQAIDYVCSANTALCTIELAGYIDTL